MARLERALDAQSLYWIKDGEGDRIGIVWGLDGEWRWSVGAHPSRPAASFEEAQSAAAGVLGEPILFKGRSR
ncbi:MAG: hypothetical protein KDJ20_11275 [Hyphomicrobiales bacterium]|nr:hypothetical protein [Rhodoblastus sp.]MCC0000106.1 hypothetical protein [Methylobacteriaceae bacterium]MCC2102139.1 hypothetical protein [Hyphomicrobiales bacterium]HRY02696.1 hypothetical protein [Beijerinckiaceae bacterium]MCC2104556.1 hypothetical protein [Hyphomicrobiales bacterium]